MKPLKQFKLEFCMITLYIYIKKYHVKVVWYSECKSKLSNELSAVVKKEPQSVFLRLSVCYLSL